MLTLEKNVKNCTKWVEILKQTQNLRRILLY